MKKRFEYKTLVIKPKTTFWTSDYDQEEIDKTLNKLGSDGWELVSVESRDFGGTSYSLMYTFKREI